MQLKFNRALRASYVSNLWGAVHLFGTGIFGICSERNPSSRPVPLRRSILAILHLNIEVTCPRLRRKVDDDRFRLHQARMLCFRMNVLVRQNRNRKGSRNRNGSGGAILRSQIDRKIDPSAIPELLPRVRQSPCRMHAISPASMPGERGRTQIQPWRSYQAHVSCQGPPQPAARNAPLSADLSCINPGSLTHAPPAGPRTSPRTTSKPARQ